MFRYEEEIARLKRGEEIAEDHRPLLPSSTAGQIALAGLQSTLGEKRMAPSASSEEAQHQRNVRLRENSQTGGAIGDIAAAAMVSAGSLSSASASTAATASAANTSAIAPSPSVAYDWLVTYNPKAQRLLSIDLLQSLNFDGVVCCVRFSNSGKFLAASGNKLCNIYEAKSGIKLASFPHDSIDGGDLYVRSLTFNSSDNLFATGSEDNSIRVWDISTLSTGTEAPKLIQTLKGHTQDVYALEFLDEDRIVSGSGDQSLKLWSVSEGECLASIQSHPSSSSNDNVDGPRESGITSLSISQDRKFIATGSLDRIVRVFELFDELNKEEFKLIETFEGHTDSVYSVTFDPHDSTVISGSLDRTIRKWSINTMNEAATEKCLQVISIHRDFVLSVAVSFPSKSSRPFIISGSKDRTVQFWDETSESQQLTLQGHKNSVISVAMSPAGGVFATGSGDGRARIWSFTSKTE